jgi:hypothetical protein
MKYIIAFFSFVFFLPVHAHGFSREQADRKADEITKECLKKATEAYNDYIGADDMAVPAAHHAMELGAQGNDCIKGRIVEEINKAFEGKYRAGMLSQLDVMDASIEKFTWGYYNEHKYGNDGMIAQVLAVRERGNYWWKILSELIFLNNAKSSR